MPDQPLLCRHQRIIAGGAEMGGVLAPRRSPCRHFSPSRSPPTWRSARAHVPIRRRHRPERIPASPSRPPGAHPSSLVPIAAAHHSPGSSKCRGCPHHADRPRTGFQRSFRRCPRACPSPAGLLSTGHDDWHRTRAWMVSSGGSHWLPNLARPACSGKGGRTRPAMQRRNHHGGQSGAAARPVRHRPAGDRGAGCDRRPDRPAGHAPLHRAGRRRIRCWMRCWRRRSRPRRNPTCSSTPSW